MQFRNTPTDYGWITIALHWGMALLVFGLFGLGLYMTELTYYDPWYRAAPDLHRSLGILVGALMVLRLAWRALNPSPQAEPGHKTWEVRAAHLVHRALYLLLFAIVISGYLISTADGRSIQVFDWFQVPALLPPMENMEDYAGSVHFALAVFTIGLATLHALAALKHHFITKDRTLLRMLGLRRGNQTP